MSWRVRANPREIGDFIAAENPSRARSFVSELRTRCQALGRQPMMGRPAPEVAPDVRILVFRSFLILHRVFDDRISIDRVVHSARDRSTLPSNE
ncbi:type II toxin-antitoxin system RelE/ParE family toxin [Methylobacterium sp. E-065]|uniref:type II toxin-antitoxin system RelE/ParE family toxin n=1 Tax=Methylobacterium sp. E-065 TaxID=2836583 RepID=UPI0039195E04